MMNVELPCRKVIIKPSYSYYSYSYYHYYYYDYFYYYHHYYNFESCG